MSISREEKEARLKAFCEQFPPLWEGFEAKLKEQYTRSVALGSIVPHSKDIQNLYSKVAWDHWGYDGYGGAGAKWMDEFKMIFHGKRFRPLWEDFHFFFGLDKLVAESAGALPVFLTTGATPLEKDGKRLEEYYRLTLKPHLDARRQKIQDGLEKASWELFQPVPYALELPLEGETRELALTFQSEREEGHMIGVPLDGCTYSYNGRSYRDVDSLLAEETEELAPNVFLGVDAYGEGVLVTRRWVPTFDDADREWDSQVRKYLFFDGANIHLAIMRGGYKIASLTFYETLLSADSRLKPLFEKLGWPTNTIDWAQA